jgi:hypothetical protein
LDLWPEGIKSGGYYVKSDNHAVARKMKRFFKQYPYSKEDVFEVTKHYLQIKQNEGWKGIQLAHYFIDKEGLSNLAMYCKNKDTKKPSDGSSFSRDL